MAVATGIELLTEALCQPITSIDMLKNIEQGNYEKAAALGLSAIAGVKELIDDTKRPCDNSAKSFLDFDTTNHTILTNQGIKRVKNVSF
ncbi:hypothetical protein [Campylobacter corcagiensis]|uniref:Uncharacterized protein n=1 Tax=Campylobacter corcagiensis TaxID=1448857 RepID=A0A7M1LF06_9BACT|nr:hypothetical protein [Campylobacter corcagiensis]QKF64927.1 hypothetical protein CCORG_1078 [Campylobacter corcagiensis]QOQ86913.1 hypothetical protein IMC76_06775 [Campylobacter corcagiensis]